MTFSEEDFIQGKEKLTKLIYEIEKVVIGKREVLQLTVAGILAEGHLLFEDIPGVGKTMLVKTLAAALGCDCRRVQFTPELMPADINGLNVYNQKTQSFDFQRGPIFTNILLADEINRGTPKTQSALLEAMAEQQVTIDGVTYGLNEPFVVLATENPLESEGTYPLPEAQRDRFLMQLSIGYPAFADELKLLQGYFPKERLAEVQPVLSIAELTLLKQMVQEVYVAPSLLNYALQLVRMTRHHAKIRLGVSPRGAMAFVRAAQAYAVLEGRDFCKPEDFAKVYGSVFQHRILLQGRLQSKKEEKAAVLEDIFQKVLVPLKGQET